MAQRLREVLIQNRHDTRFRSSQSQSDLFLVSQHDSISPADRPCDRGQACRSARIRGHDPTHHGVTGVECFRGSGRARSVFFWACVPDSRARARGVARGSQLSGHFTAVDRTFAFNALAAPRGTARLGSPVALHPSAAPDRSASRIGNQAPIGTEHQSHQRLRRLGSMTTHAGSNHRHSPGWVSWPSEACRARASSITFHSSVKKCRALS